MLWSWQVIAKALAQEEAKLALVQQRIARGHGTDATDARAPLRPKLLEHSVTHSRRQEPLKQEQQTELKLQLANTRLRAVTRYAALACARVRACTCSA